MKKATAVLLTVLCLFAALALAGCGESNNSPIVGEWKPSTVSIGGTTISYSDLETKDKEFAFEFYDNGKCRIIIGGVTNEGTYVFNETSVDIEYGGKTQKLNYDKGILTLKLDYHNRTTAYMFTKVTN